MGSRTHDDRARGTTCLLLTLIALVFAAVLPARAAADVTATCTTPTATVASCASWFTTDVLVHWNVADCPDQKITADTLGEVVSCTSTDENGMPITAQVVIKRDTTLPEVGAGQAARGADDTGWYTKPVAIGFTGTDTLSGIGSCVPVTYTGPDTTAGSVVGTCTDVAGNVGSSPPFVLKYDATGPVVTAAVPDRPPDYHGWYTAPVTFGFLGTDATSGLAACAPATYAGPDNASAAIVGTCRDNAGNSKSQMFSLKYDATPPPVLGLRAVPGDRRVAIHWTTTADVTFVQVLRVPGMGSNAASVVFNGPGSSFVDTDVDNGVTYVYGVDLRDAAGNESSDVVKATPRLPSVDPVPGTGSVTPGPRPRGARLRFPRANAMISASRPPVLRWTRVRHARYYNVQLHRGGRKILSAWPRPPRYRLQRRWSYGGKLRRLAAGRYVWYVWPGYGRRSAARYGDLIGRRAFRVGQPR
jgi:hypothetical protein